MHEPARDHFDEEPEKRDLLDEDASAHRAGSDWWESDQIDAVGWGFAFVWAALVLLADKLSIASTYPWWDAWSVFFIGAGVITLIGATARLITTNQTGKAVGGYVFALILLGIGVGEALVWFWPAVLAVVGILILRSVFSSRGK